MKSKTKIWLGVGAFVMAGGVTQNPPGVEARSLLMDAAASDTAIARVPGHTVLAQHRRHGAEDGEKVRARQGGEGGERARAKGGEGGEKARRQGGEGEGEGGEGEEGGARGGVKLPPDLDFALRIAQMRGHLLVGDELVKEGQWNAAFPHFRHPTEELYGGIRARLKEYRTPPFEAALKALANVVKSKKGGEAYDKAFKAVTDALAATDEGLRAKQANWDSFEVEAALETLKSATGEYQEAMVKGRIAKPVEYQDARGFVLQAEKMIDAVAPALEKKDADALSRVRAAFTELKKAFPTAMSPKVPVKDYGNVLSDVSRVELAAGKLM
jgi:hypothetical protein